MKIIDDSGKEYEGFITKLSKSGKYLNIIQVPVNTLYPQSIGDLFQNLSESLKDRGVTNFVLIPIPDKNHKLIFNKKESAPAEFKI